MFDALFTSTTTTSGFGIQGYVTCVVASLICGLVLALVYMFRSHYTKSFVTTMVVLPAMVCIVIMMVNGNLGAGVAVAGAFSLVRFRSASGSARDIAFIFLAMAVGLVSGMGYIAYAFLTTALIGLIFLVLQASGFGTTASSPEMMLRVTVPEDLDFSGPFDRVLEDFTTYHKLTQVKTTNMGSLFRLTYEICLKDVSQQKALIDAVRCHNANLEVSLSQMETVAAEL